MSHRLYLLLGSRKDTRGSLVLEVDYVVHSASDQMDLSAATMSQAQSLR
jgi:hypothetical protein